MKKIFIILLFCFSYGIANEKKDLTIVGSIDFNGSVRRHSISLIDSLKDKLKINFILTRPRQADFTGINQDVKDIVTSKFDSPSNVTILEDPLWYFDKTVEEKTRGSKIRLAFSVFEADQIPAYWVKLLNKFFDGVIVPDEFLVEVYKKSGVKIPIFLVPLGIYIDEFLELPIKKNVNKPFVFGCTARFFKRKRHNTILEAFIKEFGNNKDVILRINGGGKHGLPSIYNYLKKRIKELGIKNIIITNDALSWDKYIDLMSSFDCLINISTGEGFSITPREALSIGLPCILSNNTAQKSICKTRLVRQIPSNIKIPNWCNKEKKIVGNKFECTVKDTQKALKDVYDNYDYYLSKAQKGRDWVQQFRFKNLHLKYINLIKPKKVILGDKNIVTDEYIMTDSEKLYSKYHEIAKINNVK